MRTAYLASMLVLVCLFGSVAQSQEAKTEKPAPRVQTVRVDQLRGLLNQNVVIDGITGQKRDDSAQNTKVYSLVDDFNKVVWVRTKRDYPPIGTRYRVEGIVLLTNNEIFLVEDNRVSLSGGHEGGTGGDPPPPPGKEDEPKGMPTTTLIGIGLIALALVISIVIFATIRRQQQQQMLVAEQQRQAMERERQRAEEERLSRLPQPKPRDTEVDPPGSPPGPHRRKPQHTIDSWGQIKITAGPHSGQMIPMSGHKISIGRENADVKLTDDSVVSSEHGEIVVTNDGRLLYVDKSRNGSTVDGKLVHRDQVDISPGSIIEVGSSKLELIAARIPSARGPAPASSSASAPTMFGDVPPPSSARTGQFMGVEFVVTNGPDKDKRYPVGKESITIGRADGQDFQLADGFVSRAHAVLAKRDADWVLQNCSEKGTTVNGESVTEKTLQHGDRIALGSTVMEFQTMMGAISGLSS